MNYKNYHDMLVGKAVIAAKREKYTEDDIRDHISVNFDWYGVAFRGYLDKECFVNAATIAALQIYNDWKEESELFD